MFFSKPLDDMYKKMQNKVIEAYADDFMSVMKKMPSKIILGKKGK